MHRKLLIVILVGTPLAVFLALFVVPRYVAYVSREAVGINRNLAAEEESEALQARALGSLRTLATAANTYRSDHGRFPRDDNELEVSQLVSSDFFSSVGYNVAYMDKNSDHFIATAQAAGVDFCTDESEVVRIGGISEANQCVGTVVK